MYILSNTSAPNYIYAHSLLALFPGSPILGMRLSSYHATLSAYVIGRSVFFLPFHSESDEFELFFPTRLDELLKEAYALEEGLKQQKERMKEMLTHLSQTLDRLSHTT